MPRPIRIDYPGALHHVMNRGAGRRDVFTDHVQCAAFCDLLGEVVARYNIRVHGFALMPNHYHLMVESVQGNLSRAMSYLNGYYTQDVNREQGTDGSIFRGRFHNRLVTDPGHWRHLLVYLHLNPVKARLVMRINQWRWTSHSFYNGTKVAPDWLTTESLFDELGGVDGYRIYLQESRQGRRERPDGFDCVLFGGRRSSGMAVVKQEETGRELDAEQALAQILEVTGEPAEELMREVRGRGGNPVRSVAAWWLVMGAGLSNGEVGNRLEMSPVAVSRAIARVRREQQQNPTCKIADWVDELWSKGE